MQDLRSLLVTIILGCNVRLDFNSSIRNLSFTYDIIDDDSCDFQVNGKRQEGVELFKVDLTLANSTDDLVAIDFANAEATIFIDDSKEEECSYLHDRCMNIDI